MHYCARVLLLVVAGITQLTWLYADDRRFTYVYEPETMVAGALEFENWITLRESRSAEAGQDEFTRWDLRNVLATSSVG
jgi:hypothetical protein